MRWHPLELLLPTPSVFQDVRKAVRADAVSDFLHAKFSRFSCHPVRSLEFHPFRTDVYSQTPRARRQQTAGSVGPYLRGLDRWPVNHLYCRGFNAEPPQPVSGDGHVHLPDQAGRVTTKLKPCGLSGSPNPGEQPLVDFYNDRTFYVTPQRCADDGSRDAWCTIFHSESLELSVHRHYSVLGVHLVAHFAPPL